MAVIDELKTASYRGVSFFYKSSSETSGFKNAQHFYPGSDNFKVEQLGKMPKRFDIESRVLFQDRDRFDNALNTPGVGILSHPMFGNFSVKVTEYTKTDTVDDLGLYNYSIQFVVELGLIIPTIESIATSVVNTIRANVFTAATNFMKNTLGSFGF